MNFKLQLKKNEVKRIKASLEVEKRFGKRKNKCKHRLYKLRRDTLGGGGNMVRTQLCFV